MTSPGGQEVGRISVRVVPDTSRFRRTLERDLKAITRGLEFEVPGEADMSRFRAQVERATRNMPNASIDVDANFRRDALDQLEESLRKLESKDLGKDLLRSAADGLRAKIDLEVDPSSRRQWRSEIEDELSSLRGLAFDLEPRLLKTNSFKAEIARLNAWVKSFNQEIEVDVRVTVDRNRITRALSAGLSGLRQIAATSANAAETGLKSLVTGLRNATNTALKFGEAGAIIAAVIAVAAPAFALLTGSLVALPGALAAVAVPMGVIALGLDGITKAAETAKPAFEELKKTISDTFAQDLVPGFEKIRDRLIPALELPLQGVAQSLSSAFNGVIDTLTSGEGLNNLQRTIDNVAAGIRTATPGLQAFTDGLNQLVASLSKGFPGMGEAFTRLGESFSGWIDKITANGELERAMGNLRDTFKEIGGALGDIAKWSWDNLADPAFGEKMKQFAADLRAIINDLLPLLKSGFEDVADIINGIVNAIKAVKDAAAGFEKLTGGSAPTEARLAEQKKKWGVWSDFGINDDANVVKWYKKLFGDASEAAGQAGSDAAKQFQQNLASAAAATGGDAGALTEAINNQLTSAVNVSKEAQAAALKSAFAGDGVTDAVKAQIGTQMTGIIEQATAAVTQLGPVLQQGIDQAVLPLSTLPEKVGQAFGVLGPSISGAWTVVTQTVQAGVDQMTTAISTAFNMLPQTATTAFQGIQQSITGAFGFMVLSIGQQAGNITNAVQQAFSQIPQAIGSALGQAVQVTASTAGQIVTAFQAAMAQLPPLVQQAFAPMVQTVTDTMSQLVAAVVSGGAQVVAEVQTWPGRIQGILQGLASAASASGAAVGREFAAGIASQSGAVAAAAQQLVDAARKFFPNSPAETGPFSGSGWVDRSGEAVGSAFAQGITSSAGNVVSAAREMMQAIKDVFGSAEGLTLNFNFGAVTQQFGQMASAAKSFQTSLADTAKLNVPQFGDAADPSMKADLDMQMRQLEMERKSLEIQRAQGMGDQAAIKARLEEIRLQKLQLGLQQNQLTYAEKYGDAAGGTADHYAELSKKAQDLPTDFAKATGQQFMSDLGMSGQGLIPSLLEQGTQYIFQVANMDTALSAQQTLQRKQALGLVGR